MRDIALLFIHLLATIARFIRPGGARSVVAESLLLKHHSFLVSISTKPSFGEFSPGIFGGNRRAAFLG